MEKLNLILSCLLLGLIGWFLIGTARRKKGFSRLLRRDKEEPLSPDQALVYWALILFFTLLRLYRFGSVPGGFNQDGAMAAVDALALTTHGTDRFGTWLPAHFTAWGYGQMSVLLSYCMVPFFRLFGMNAVTARLPMLLWSFAGMAAAYGFLRRLLNRRAALLGLLFLCICPWHFMQSRWALDCNLFPHAFLLGLALLYRGAERPAALCGSMVFFALGMYSYGVAFLSVPLFLLLACILLLAQKRIRLGQALLCALIYFGLSFPIYGTMLINAMGWETVKLPFVTMPYFPDSVRANDMIFYSAEPLRQLAVNAKALWNVGFLQGHDLPWNAIDGFGTVYRCSWPLLAFGLILCLVRAFRDADPRRRLGCALLLLFWLCGLFTGLCVNSVNVNRLNLLFYAHVLFIVIALEELLRFHRLTALPLLACYLLCAGLFFHSYFGPWSERISDLFYEDFLTAVETAGERDFEKLIITPDTQFTGSRQVSEILTLFALDLDAEYYRGETDDPVPYRERFSYRNLTAQDLVFPPPGSCWVLKTATLPPALPKGWVTEQFGDYSILYYTGG